MKKCISCGREIPDAANFCPHCEALQNNRVKTVPFRPENRSHIVFGVLFIAAIIFITVYLGIIMPAENAKPAPVPVEDPLQVPIEDPSQADPEAQEGSGILAGLHLGV